jgi:hypothetical protein
VTEPKDALLIELARLRADNLAALKVAMDAVTLAYYAMVFGAAADPVRFDKLVRALRLTLQQCPEEQHDARGSIKALLAKVESAREMADEIAAHGVMRPV